MPVQLRVPTPARLRRMVLDLPPGLRPHHRWVMAPAAWERVREQQPADCGEATLLGLEVEVNTDVDAVHLVPWPYPQDCLEGRPLNEPPAPTGRVPPTCVQTGQG